MFKDVQLKRKNVVLKMLLWRGGKAQQEIKRWLSRRWLICFQFQYSPLRFSPYIVFHFK